MDGASVQPIGEVLPLWAGPPTPRDQVLAEADQRGWFVLAPPTPAPTVFIDCGEADLLTAAFDTSGQLIAFAVSMPAQTPGVPYSSAIGLALVAQRLWGTPEIQPRRLTWHTPEGRCEIQEEGDRVRVTWRHHTAPANSLDETGQQLVDAMIAEAAQDPRWQQAVDQAQTLLGPAPPWLLAQLGALFVHDIANSTGIAPNEVTAEQLNHQLTDLGQHASNAQRRHARNRRP